MSGFTTYNSSGTSAGVLGTSAAFNYDPLYTGSVPTQNIPSGTTNIGYVPGSWLFNGSSYGLAQSTQYEGGIYNSFSQFAGGQVASLGGAGSFTVELWIYPTATSIAMMSASAYAVPAQSSGWVFGINANNSLYWNYNGVAIVTSAASAIKTNVWQHVAYVRNGTSAVLYVNGVSVASGTDSNTYLSTWNGWAIGVINGAASIYNGYMSQIRVSKSAVYTTAFTPSPNLGLTSTTIAYFPAPSSTSFISDFSPSGLIFQVSSGVVAYSAFAPAVNSLSNGVFFIDTTANIATANSSAFNFGTGNFTVEYWLSAGIVPTTNQGFAVISGTGNVLRDITNLTSGGEGWGVINLSNSAVATFTNLYVTSPNAWNHIAWGKSGSNMTIWINGQQVASTVYSANIIGNSFSFNRNANIANVSLGPVRVSNSAVYTTGTNFSPPYTFTNTANTVLLLRGGANLSQYLTDQSVNAIAVSAFGNVVSGSATTQYGISGNVVGDISGAQNTGLVLRASGVGNATGVVFDNNYGGYWQFNGNTTNSAIISTTQVSNSQSSFSQSVWFQTSTANGILTMFQNNISPVSSGSLLNGLLVNATGRLSFYTYLTVALQAQGNIATANVLDNKWHHAAVTYNSVTKTANTYLDGQLGNTLAIGGANNIVLYSGYWAVGGASQGVVGGVGNAFRGNIGPTAIYSSMLTANQVSQIYSTQVQRFGNIGNNTANFSYTTGSVQTFTVPNYVTRLTARVVGAAGGAGTQVNSSGNTGTLINNGGGGANISATFTVTPGQTLYVVAGLGGQATNIINNTSGNIQGNIAAGNLAQGGGGGSYSSYSGGGWGGASGGGFSGIFTQNPSNAAIAASSAILVAGGGGGAQANRAVTAGGNASVIISANSSPGFSFPSSIYLQSVTGLVSNGTTISGNLVTTFVNRTNYSVGEPVSFVGAAGITNTNIYFVSAANATSITATTGPNGIPSSGTVSGTAQIYAGGYNGSAALGYNIGGGGWATPGNGGYQGMVYNGGTVASTVYPTGGTQFQGGSGGFALGFTSGGGAGGGYYGGGGGAAGGNTAGGAGGGSNYANTQIVNNIAYGTLTVNNYANTTPINGYVTLSW